MQNIILIQVQIKEEWPTFLLLQERWIYAITINDLLYIAIKDCTSLQSHYATVSISM